jgi:hypothetical protein
MGIVCADLSLVRGMQISTHNSHHLGRRVISPGSGGVIPESWESLS